ncbi:MAG: NAD(P)H-dependent oxidoreductase [Erysipelotrichaceae bacterium]|nr:NAD(P)H-dependent oxidoreductase [Erysipelotrichaceae bacterium]
MNILVINGSPKGNNSITLQTVLYLEKLHPEHSFEILNAGQRINGLRKDFSSVLPMIEKADLFLFSYPVYTFMAPSQLHEFIHLLKKQRIDLSKKFATQITTSKHFYDITAHRYIQDNCNDLKLKFIKGLSADMEDLPLKKGQKEAKEFFDYVLWCMNHNYHEPVYESVPDTKPVLSTTITPQPIKSDKEIVIVTDYEDNDSLKAMIEHFQNKLEVKSRIINLNQIRIDGGCLGCFGCAADGKCIYKDKFDVLLKDEIQTKSAIVYAFTITDHSMGPLFKRYDDRQFCNGHRTVTMGTSVGYLISGNLSKEENLRTILEARANVGGNFLAGIATDETNPDAQIDELASKLTYAIEHDYVQPSNFYGVGGMKIFRDLIYQMQGMMKADHKFFKSHGQYDFPQNNKGKMLMMYLVGFMMTNKTLKLKMGNKMNEGMLMPYKKVLDELDKN